MFLQFLFACLNALSTTECLLHFFLRLGRGLGGLERGPVCIGVLQGGQEIAQGLQGAVGGGIQGLFHFVVAQLIWKKFGK